MEEKKKELQNHIHWYPGHIAKAERVLKEKINLVDVVIEVLDARLPLSSAYGDLSKIIGEKPRLILLNKADLTDDNELKFWHDYIKNKENVPVIISEAKNSKGLNKVISAAINLAEPKIQALMKKGLLRRPARAVVIGMPNVGKSSIINKLTHSSKTKVGAKAGVTRQQQWVRINPKLELLDTPGIIPMRQNDQIKAQKLAFVNSVSENAYDEEQVCIELLKLLDKKYPTVTRQHYGLDEHQSLTIENIAHRRNWIVKGGAEDVQRTAVFILNDFRSGKIGRFILDEQPV
ncbi:ribosome biogenesis GTPase YlqF [bacterium]|nr:ribosome biogenesis GTPase YlqF [bacterium]